MRVSMCVGALAVVFAAGCHGFPYPEPIAQAEHKPEKYATYAAAPETPLTAGQQRWLLLPGAYAGVPASVLVPIPGTTGILRASWDDAPFDLIYAPGADGLLHIGGEVR
jgi:hypothetical protein